MELQTIKLNGHKAIAHGKQSNYNFTLVPAQHCASIWGEVSGMLKPAVDRSDGRWTIESLFDSLYTGNQSLWVAYDDEKSITCAMTTQIVGYPNSKMLAIQFLGGADYNDWSDDMLSLVTNYAKDCGCDGIEAVARFGFWPLFKRNGFNRAYVTYEKNFHEQL